MSGSELALAMELPLEVNGLSVSSVGMVGDVSSLTDEQLVSATMHALLWWGASTWVLGDLVAELQRRALRGEPLPEVAWANLHQATASKAVTVVAAFPLPRRRPALTWSHHELVAGMDERNQDRLLDAAADGALSVRGLRALIAQEAEDRRPQLGGMPVAKWKPPTRLALRVGEVLAVHPEAATEIEAAVAEVLGRWGK